MSVAPRRVALIQAVAKQYRRPFFTQLWSDLANDGIQLDVVYSPPNPTEAVRGDSVELPHEYGRCVPGYWMLGTRLLWQPIWRFVKSADLVIIEQANKYVNNYPLMLGSFLGVKKVGFWGHGRNRQARQNSVLERSKRLTLHRCDWWFAYTKGVADYIISQGFPAYRVTAIQNSIDMSGWRKDLAGVQEHELADLRAELGIRNGDHTGLFCGSLHADKCLRFLIDAADRIHARRAGFHLVIAGAGPEQSLVAAAAAQRPWLRYVGRVEGKDKARLHRLADLVLNPGMIGLGVLDSLAAGMPIVTTDVPFHSPEVEYLEQGVSGIMTEHAVDAFATAVLALLADDGQRAGLRAGALRASEDYSLDRMVANFRTGVAGCLAT